MGLKYGLPLLSPVDDAGIFTEEAGPFQGLQVNSHTCPVMLPVQLPGQLSSQLPDQLPP